MWSWGWGFGISAWSGLSCRRVARFCALVVIFVLSYVIAGVPLCFYRRLRVLAREPPPSFPPFFLPSLPPSLFPPSSFYERPLRLLYYFPSLTDRAAPCRFVFQRCFCLQGATRTGASRSAARGPRHKRILPPPPRPPRPPYSRRGTSILTSASAPSASLLSPPIPSSLSLHLHLHLPLPPSRPAPLPAPPPNPPPPPPSPLRPPSSSSLPFPPPQPPFCVPLFRSSSGC